MCANVIMNADTDLLKTYVEDIKNVVSSMYGTNIFENILNKCRELNNMCGFTNGLYNDYFLVVESGEHKYYNVKEFNDIVELYNNNVEKYKARDDYKQRSVYVVSLCEYIINEYFGNYKVEERCVFGDENVLVMIVLFVLFVENYSVNDGYENVFDDEHVNEFYNLLCKNNVTSNLYYKVFVLLKCVNLYVNSVECKDHIDLHDVFDETLNTKSDVLSRCKLFKNNLFYTLSSLILNKIYRSKSSLDVECYNNFRSDHGALIDIGCRYVGNEKYYKLLLITGVLLTLNVKQVKTFNVNDITKINEHNGAILIGDKYSQMNVVEKQNDSIVLYDLNSKNNSNIARIFYDENKLMLYLNSSDAFDYDRRYVNTLFNMIQLYLLMLVVVFVLVTMYSNKLRGVFNNLYSSSRHH